MAKFDEKAAAETTVVHNGVSFRFRHQNADDHVFANMAKTGVFYESDLLVAVAPFLRRGNHVMDVGANVGTHTVFFAGVCGCEVTAFEPNSAATDQLAANIAANALQDRVTVEQVALGAQPARARIVAGAENNLGTARTELDDNGDVPVGILDDYLGARRVKLIKIDVEGSELAVLQGARRTLERDHPVVTVEARSQHEYNDIRAFLSEFGYVPAGTYGFTPTHVFVDAAKHSVADSLAAIGNRLALDRIADLERREQINHMKTWIGSVQDGLRSSQDTIGAMETRIVDQEREAVELKGTASKLASMLDGIAKHANFRDEQMTHRFDAIGQTLESLMAAIKGLEARTAAAETTSGRLSERIAETGETVGRSLTLTDQRIGAIHASLAQDVEGIVRGIETLASKMAGLETRLAATEAASVHIEETGAARDEALRALLTDTFSRLATKIDTQLGVLGASLSATEQRICAVDAALAAAASRDNAAMELQLLVSSTLEAHIASAADGLKKEQARSIKSAVAPIARAHLDAMGRSLAEAVGRQLAELEIDLKNELGRNSPAAASSAEDAPAIDVALARISKERCGIAHEAQPTQKDVAPPAKKTRWSVQKNSPDTTVHGATSMGMARRWSVKGNGAAALHPSADASACHKPADKTRRDMPLRFSAPDAVVFGSDHFLQGWSGRAWAQPTIDLQPDGHIVGRDAKAYLGVIGKSYPLDGGGLFEVEVTSTTLAPPGARRVLRLVDDDGEDIGHDVLLQDGPTVVRAYAPPRVKAVKFYVLAIEPDPGPLFTLASIEFRKIDPAAYQRAVRASIGEPVYASMASIPSRHDMLRDTIGSLLLQCDKVRVFLNNYTEVPTFLDHPRIEIRRSQDWDDRGDAGKVFWLERDRHEGGYRLIVDDDLIFPPDFATLMTAKVASRGNRAIYATHGVLLRQPIVNYYAKGSRAATFHFSHELKHDRGVHIGATNALCLHSSAVDMRWQDFKYCNSADIWLSLYAQKHSLPILTPARPRNWVRESRHANPKETIYQHSLARTRTRFDSSFVQDAVLRHTGTITLQTAGRRKLGVAFLVDDVAKWQAALESFLARRSVDVEWVVMLVFDAKCAEQLSTIAAADIDQETHLVDNAGDLCVAMQNIARLHRSLGLEATLIVSPETRIVSVSADDDAILTDKAVHNQDIAVTPLYAKGGDHALAAVLSSATTDAVKAFNGAFLSATGTASGLYLAATAQTAEQVIAHAIALFAKRKTEPLPETSKRRGDTVNTFFDRAVVLNLDRRPDRWASMSQQLDAAGIVAQRFSAVDGSSPAVRAEHDAYATQSIHVVSNAVAPVAHSSDLYLSYESQMARIAHLEGRAGKKAIESPGTWGYMRSYEAILEQALIDQLDSLLVLDDDVILHKDFRALFAAVAAELPDDWMVLQLGTLQYNWTREWVKTRSPHLYSTNGSAVGSHAVGLRFEAFPYVLDHVKRMDLPFDIGALSATTRAFADRCFVITPNLAVQRLSDSDINTSEFQRARSRVDMAKTYRWNLDDYHA